MQITSDQIKSCIPEERDLIRKGPYGMDVRSFSRGRKEVRFFDDTGSWLYTWEGCNLAGNNGCLKLSETLAGKENIYLWIDEENLIQKIWKAELNQETILSYDDALDSYSKRTSSTSLLIAVFILLLLWIYFSINIKRISKN